MPGLGFPGTVRGIGAIPNDTSNWNEVSRVRPAQKAFSADGSLVGAADK
jgi:hypothetical protein